MSSTDLRALRAPFTDDDIEWRVQRSGWKNHKPWAMLVAYLTARSIQNRLDDVVGPGNWSARYREMGGGVICELGLKIEGEWTYKEDGAPYSDIETLKGGISGAFKRAAVTWGMGRQLYDLEPTFADFVERGTRNALKVRLKNDMGKEEDFFIRRPRLSPALRGEDNVPKPPPAEQTKPAVPAPLPVIKPVEPLEPKSPELGETVIKVKCVYLGRKFKDVHLPDLRKYARTSEDWFLKQKRPIPSEWKEFFDAIGQYMYGKRSEAPVVEQGELPSPDETKQVSASDVT